MTDKDTPRFLLTAVIIGYFGYALFAHWSEGLEETLKNIVMLAIGYWLGSSKGSSDKASQLEKQAEGPAGTPDDPLAVEGAEKDSTPVPVQEKKAKPGG